MRSLPLLCLPLLLVPVVRADAPAGVEFFEKKVRPVLVEHCYPCHSTQAKKKRGGLSLDSRQAMRKGGDTGPAVVPGQPERSLLLRAVRYRDDKLRMPPNSKLPDAVIADLERWLAAGAPAPRDAAGTSTTGAWQEVLKQRRGWWGLQPVKKHAPPPVNDSAWPLDPIDRFILARLEEKGLRPAPPAERRALARRLALVLTGLPPAPEEVEAFVNDRRPAAYERYVDRLLASPHFGERWARHWMDVVRFTETHGNEWNYEVHHAWRYRDYLVRAFNDDLPYDQLVREHIAGDLLDRPRFNAHGRFNESVIGTAFYRFGEVNHDDCIEFRGIGYDLWDNQLDTLTKAFQATTVACARCHDHKIDAVSMADYYGLLGVLRGSRLVSHTIDTAEVNRQTKDELRSLKGQIRRELAAAWLREVRDLPRYLLAAQAKRDKRPDADQRGKGLGAGRLGHWVKALRAAKAPESPLSPWLARGSEPVEAAWRKQSAWLTGESKARADFNRRHFTTWADFRPAPAAGWQAVGQGLQHVPAGDFTVAASGDRAVTAVLPAGMFTHALSEKLNGALRSPVVPAGRKHISFQVLGGHSAAVRLVSNGCQLNYANYRALRSGSLSWVRFNVPAEAASLRSYAELMTKFDNPKFPDQLGTLGGDSTNQRVPWERAAADPRSFFGITRIVLHDGTESPRDELTHLRRLFEGPAPKTEADLADRYARAVTAALEAWAGDRAGDDDVAWLDWLLRHDLVSNSHRSTPRLQALVERYRAAEARLALPRIVPGLGDHGDGLDQPLLVRGNPLAPGKSVPRRYLEVLSRPGEKFAGPGSGRRELAERIASKDNPLTARVMVNRVWHHLFGAGLVRTTDDFGRLGELPSHPELLDHLAGRFVEQGWSIKQLIRAVVRTRTFRMASRAVPAAREIDPGNRLLHHYPARRLEAEAIRDSILAASGRLDRRLFGPSIHPWRASANEDRRLFPGPLDGAGRRSVYIKVNLMEPPPFLGSFNFPGGKVAQGRRDVTNVPAQALALLNDPFVLQQAGYWGQRLAERRDASVSARLDHLFHVALCRPPSEEERQRFVEVVAELAELHGVKPGEVLSSQAVWKDVAHTMFNLKEFIYVP